MTRRLLGFSLVLLVLTASRLAHATASVTLKDGATGITTVNTGSVAVGAMATSNSITITADTGQPTVKIIIDTNCAYKADFAFSATTINLTGNPGTGTFTVTYTGSTPRGAHACNFQVVDGTTTTTVYGTFSVSGTTVAPVIGVAPATKDFGSIRVLDTATTPTASQVFTVSNTGDAGQTLTVSSIAFSGTNPTDFTVTAGPTFPANISAGGNATWTVSFNPSATGARSATMSINSNDPVTAAKTVALTGTGTAAVIGISDVNFNTVAAGTTVSLNSTLSNSDATMGVLTATAATLATSDGNTWFSFGAGLGCTAGTTACSLSGATAPPSKSIPVRCNPPADGTGTKTATLTITSDTDGGGDNLATLTCTAGRPNIAIDMTSLDFMGQLVNTTSTAQTVMVTNNGNTNLTFWLGKSGTDAAMFSATVAGGCGTSNLNLCTVAPNTTTSVSVTFTPTSMGAKTATLAINNNDPDTGDNPQNVTLAGSGIAPVATANPTSLSFGNVEVGKTSSGMMVTVQNTGTATLTISNAALTAGATDFAVTLGTTGTQTTMVAPNGSVSWTLTCSPAFGPRTGNFRVSSNGLGTATIDVPLSCTGQQGILTATPSSYDFGGVRAGDTRTTTFVLKNTGNVDVTGITSMMDAKLLGFTISGVPASLTPNATATVTITFMPATANDGCVVAAAGDCAFTLYGNWGVTPTMASTTFVARGDGLNATYDTYPASPNALDFGSIRFDATPTLPVQVINTGGSQLVIKDLGITLGTAQIGELKAATCTHNSVVVACPTLGTTSSWFTLNGVNDTLVVNMMCDPADRVAMIDGTLVVTSDLAAGQNPNRSVPLKCNSTTATLGLNPSNMVLDFGATDLDAVPVSVTRTITLTNTGAAMLNVGAATKGGTNLGRYLFGAAPATALAPGGSFSVDVTYTPNVEKPPGQPDVASITFPLVGIQGGPSSMTIQVSGYGADRHIGVGAAPAFPDTFKNPGDGAPVMPVTITNTGYAPLNVTAVMLDNEPIWTLQNPDPVTIGPASSYDFNVVFAPLMAGKAPTGHLVIMDNDNEAGKMMVSVDLNGNGLSRNVEMGPPVIPLGFTGIGIPLRLSEIDANQLMSVTNMDPVNGFRIARIKVDNIMGAEGSFEVVDASGNEPADLVLDPGATQSFDITFTPQQVGDFEATATLYLDQDPSPQAQVTLRGRGLYVDARGGGGCSATGTGSRGWLVLVVGALVASVRRRRRAAGALAVVSVIAVTANARTAAAQASNLNINLFDPTPATAGITFHAQNADIGADGSWAASALVTYANNALVLDTSQNDDAAVKTRLVLAVGGAYAFGGRFEAGAHVPIMLQSGDPAGTPMNQRFGIDPASGTALADATVHGKARLAALPLGGGMLRVGAAVALTLPTATDNQFAGSDLPTGRVLALSSLALARLSFHVNAGGVVREKTHFANINQGSGVIWAAGATFRVLDQLWAGGEAFGELIPGGKTLAPTGSQTMGATTMLDTIEGLLGVHYRPARTLDLGVALGRGITSGPGTPALRGTLMFTYTPAAEALRPIHPPRPAEPPRDDDGDGVPNKSDDCPTEQEDKDMFQDDDGCPDADNDNDGIPDAADKCPRDAEDRDRFQDDDGCPDSDNDGDGIADKQDRCPLAAEDKDGFQDQDGCPDPDNDKDGIADAADNCPLEAEVINGNADDDGCPDKGDSFVILNPDRLELLEAVQFSGSKFTRASANVLGQIGATLRAHPEILRVRVSVHVQPSRDAAADQKLSEARAKAVRDWLVDWGIDPQRLQSSGFGGKQPLVPPTTKGAAQINDRLEMIILERK